MRRKLKVAILFGGRSAEHEVSIQSAKNVYQAINKTKYEPILIGITQKGSWHLVSPTVLTLPSSTPQEVSVSISNKGVVGVASLQDADIVFPLLHGPFGEDGTVQGLLKLLNVPFVGAGVLGSAVGMDKDVMKRLFCEAGIPIVPFITVYDYEKHLVTFEDIKEKLGTPFFVKPANLGSSVGVSKVSSREEMENAIDKAFSYDRKILLEQGIAVREIECSVLGNEEKIASVVGEITPTHEFYDYEAKYLDEHGASLQIPANLAQQQVKKIQELAIQACKVLNVEGMARVDFFIDKNTNTIYINEINTIPGFTNISMYPKLWEASGIAYSELLDRLLKLALDRHTKEEKLHITQ